MTGAISLSRRHSGSAIFCPPLLGSVDSTHSEGYCQRNRDAGDDDLDNVLSEVHFEQIEREELAEKRMHAQKASSRAIISEPEEFAVDAVTVSRHRKKGQISDGIMPTAPDTLRVSYRCGMMQFTEWISLDGEGWAKEKAQAWWSRRFGGAAQDAPSLDTALQDMFLSQTLNTQTQTVTAIKTGKYAKILGYRLTADHGQFSKA